MVKQQLVKLTEDLVRFPSDSSNYEARHGVAEYIKKFIKENAQGAVVEEHTLTDSTGQRIESLHIYNPALKNKPAILLIGHVDVIAAEPEQFKPRVEGNLLYGRGAGDMKSGVAAGLLLFAKHCKNKNVQLFIANDEETTGETTQKAAEQLKPAFVVALEPTDLTIRIKEKGGIWIQINAFGPGGHGSRPWLNLNAIDILLDFYANLKQKFPNPEKELWQNTLNIGLIKGGDNLKIENGKIVLGSANIIAREASLKIDARLTEHCSIQKALSMIEEAAEQTRKQLLEKIKRLGLKPEDYKITVDEPSDVVQHLNTSEKDKYVQLLSKSYETALGKKAVLAYGPAASDARFFSVKGIPSVVFGPNSVNHHAKNEHVNINTILDTYNVMDAFLKEL